MPATVPSIHRIKPQVQTVFLQRSPAEPVLPVNHGKQGKPGVAQDRDAAAAKPADSRDRRLEPAGPNCFISLGTGFGNHDGDLVTAVIVLDQTGEAGTILFYWLVCETPPPVDVELGGRPLRIEVEPHQAKGYRPRGDACQPVGRSPVADQPGKERMVRRYLAGQQIICQEGARLFLPGHCMEVLSGSAAEPGSLDMHQQSI